MPVTKGLSEDHSTMERPRGKGRDDDAPGSIMNASFIRAQEQGLQSTAGQHHHPFSAGVTEEGGGVPC